MSIIKSRKDKTKGIKLGYMDYYLRPIRESGEVITYKLSKEELEQYLNKYKKR